MLIEREPQLEELSQALARAAEGQGALVCVEGPAGIGKSALLDVLRARAGGLAVHAAHGSQLGRGFAFGVARELLAPALDELGAEVFSGPATPARAIFAGEGGGERGALLHGLWWLLANAAERAPRLLLVDDAHWCDEPSLDMLRHVQPRLRDVPVLVVVAARPEGRALAALAARGSPRLALAPLSADGVSELVARELGSEADPGFARACHTATGGNPFLTRELLGDLRRDGVPPTAAATELVDDVRPESIAHAVLVRLAQEGAEAIRLARAVAVLEPGCRLTAAGALAEVTDPAAVASALMRCDVLADRRPLDFVHPIVRTAVYDDMTSLERGDAHARAARLLATEGAPVEQVASHLLEAEPVGDEEAVDRLAAAAADARARGAPEVAAGYLRRALDEPARGRRVELELELGRCEWTAGAEGGGLDRLRAGLAAQPPGRAFAEVACEVAQACVPLGHFEESVATLDTAIAQLPHVERELALQLEAVRASAGRLHQSTFEHAAMRLEGVAEGVSGATPAERLVLATLGATRMFQARPAGDAVALVRRAFEGGLLAEQPAGASPVYDALYVWVSCGRYEEARRMCDATLEHARVGGTLAGIGVSLCLRSMLAHRHGDVGDAEADARAALAASEGGRFVRGAIALACLGDALVARGRAGEAVELVRVHAAEGALGADWPSTLLLLSRARVRMAVGDLDAALGDLDELRRRLVYTHNPAMFAHRSLLADALTGAGERERAAAAAREELELAWTVGLPWVVGRAQRALGNATGDEALLREAVATLADADAPLEHAHALVDLGAHLRRGGRPSAARDPLREGGTLAHRCGAGALQERARDELAATGVRRVSRLLASGVEALTPSELRVARMAADGLTNRAIAQALFVTPKTVEVHLGNVYRKLEIGSRSQLPAALDGG